MTLSTLRIYTIMAAAYNENKEVNRVNEPPLLFPYFIFLFILFVTIYFILKPT